ncbi:PAS domain S-box protein [Natronorubrum texcoconense]|uniref:histidine kinase n=1 Tax=Natronorubrum texcoconense TaxID=1095776 RepID=A0A1G8WWF3_9EURY|nr:PAS domain S-box protein [Natronorubrum texcoconense]SDJ82406.1 PAS domain S-box-containing protein [Natronorubrum texcoconense]
MTDSPSKCDDSATDSPSESDDSTSESPSGIGDGPDDADPPEDAVFPNGIDLDVRQLSALVSNHAVWLLDADGRVATWNERAAALTGYDEDEIVGTQYRVFFPSESRETGRPEQLLERARAEGRAEDDGWRRRNDGDRRWVREVVAPIRDDDGDGNGDAAVDRSREGSSSVRVGVGCGEESGHLRGYAIFVHDRTTEYERERELREEKAFTQSVFEAQPDIVYAFDADGNYAEWNDRVPEVTGYDEAELADMAPLEFVAPEHRERIAAAITRVLEEDTHVTAEADLLTKDGTRLPYEFNSARITDETGTVLGFTGIGRDVSDRKARERELREEKALTESVFEAQPDLLYAYDTDRGLIHWNDRFEQLTGYDTDELEGMNPLEFIAPPDREHIERAIERIMDDGERVTEEGRVLTKDGEHIPYEFNSARITDETGAVLGFTGVGRDITDRKIRERELERLERLNATIRTIDETMVAAETRDEIESAIVEAFAAADAYRFAIIGRVDTGVAPDRLPWEPQARAGIDADGVENVRSSFVDPTDDPDESPFETGTVHCYRHLRESDVDERRTDARDRDYGSVAVVPIVASGRAYGVLVVAARESAAFADREREVLQEFGGTIGHAINAMAVRRLLYLDTVVELEFESTDRQDVCIDLSARTGCRLSLEHVLPLTDERYVYYVTVGDADPERIRSVAGDHGSISEVRRIDTTGDDSHWEFVVQGPTITGLLADYGARMRSEVVEDGVASCVVQVSPDVEVRDVVETMTSVYPEMRLVSKRTDEQAVEPRGDFRRRLERELTTKQRTALEAAYYGGYFEWPTRNSDASEIADRLGIARQTFHQHLRVAQEKLLTAYLDSGETSNG